MIYLIGGPPRCGKTTLAKILSKKLNIPYVPADYLMSVISPYVAKDEMKERLPRWYALIKTEKSNNRLYTEYTPEEIVSFYQKEAETYWPGIKNFIIYALQDNQDFIIEGAQLRPDLVSSIIKETGENKFKVLFLYKTGEGISEGLKANNDPGDWTKNDTSEETYNKIAHMIEIFGNKIKQSCLEHRLSIFDLSVNFHNNLNKLAEDLVNAS